MGGHVDAITHLIQQVLGGEPLPFIVGGLSNDPRLYQASEPFVQAMDHPLDALEEQDALFDLATALRAVAGKPHGRKRLDYQAAERAREFILAHLHLGITLEMLEHANGRERWSLSRDFQGSVWHQSLSIRDLAPPGSVPRTAA
ncbi:DNA-binding domain-containing protein, AraC-type [Pseudomonas sp. G5(2012)]|nr:DNA-binding domain-containing protein, AraC-type [Pseudomonas sp. G5(2012)]